jgi:iron complex outermembrane receptor protein
MTRGNSDASFDNWEIGQTGFVLNTNLNDASELTLSGDIYNGVVNDANNQDPEYINGENLNLLYRHTLDSGDTLRLQSYYQHMYRLDGTMNDTNAELRDIYISDLDITYTQNLDKHNLIYGVGYRYNSDNTNPNASTIAVNPQKREDSYTSFYIQDDYQISDNSHLFIGSKIEHSKYTNYEVQPSIKVLSHVTPQQTLWASISKSVRLPSRLDSDSIKRGANDLEAESALNYEIGHRYALPNLYIDSTVFVSHYDNLIEIDKASTIVDDANKTQYQYNNIMSAKVFGFESAITYEIDTYWKVGGAYSFLSVNSQMDMGAEDAYSAVKRNKTTHPKHQFNAHSYYTINHNWEFDTMVYYVDAIQSGVSSSSGGVDSYVRADFRLGYHHKDYDITLGLQRALSPNIAEYSSSSSRAINTQRNFYTTLAWRY